MTPFEQELPTLREDIKQALVFKQNRFQKSVSFPENAKPCERRAPSTQDTERPPASRKTVFCFPGLEAPDKPGHMRVLFTGELSCAH